MQQDKKLIYAIRNLVDAVVIEHCVCEGGDEALLAEEYSTKAALALLREIRASQELSSLHKWADKRLLDHGDAYATSWEDILLQMNAWIERRRGGEGGDDE